MSYIVIQHYQFPISDPFKAGHVMTEVEANVLNWHRARLIQKIVRTWVLEAIDTKGESLLSFQEAFELEQRIRDFDRIYQLSPAKEPKTSVLEYNLDLLVQNFLLRNNLNEVITRKEDIDRIKKTPEIQERARDMIRSSEIAFEELMS